MTRVRIKKKKIMVNSARSLISSLQGYEDLKNRTIVIHISW